MDDENVRNESAEAREASEAHRAHEAYEAHEADAANEAHEAHEAHEADAANEAHEAHEAHEAQAAPAPRRRARFPYARVALACVGVVLSSWLWVGESWRFDVTPKELLEGSPGWGWKGGWAGRYVRLKGTWTPAGDLGPTMLFGVDEPDGAGACVFARGHISALNHTVTRDGVTNVEHFDGRVASGEVLGRRTLIVDATRGRWTGKSVVALLIGLWGVGIAASSVWVWQKRRKLTTEIAETTEDD